MWTKVVQFRFTPEASRSFDAGLLNLIERVERICSRFPQKRIRPFHGDQRKKRAPISRGLVERSSFITECV